MNILPDALLTIGGVVRPAKGAAAYPVLSPWTGQAVGRAADAAAQDVDEAIAAARRAFDQTDWRDRHAERLALVRKLGGALRDHVPLLTNLARHEAGAALMTAQLAHVQGALASLDVLAGMFPQLEWEVDHGRAGEGARASDRRVVYEGIGVVAAITPWNVPLNVNLGKLVSALLAGCTVVLKAAPETPGAASIIGKLAVEVGFPPGVVNVLTAAHPAEAGEMLARDPRVDMVSFTGSTAVGRRIMELGSATLKRVFLELGGKSAHIVLDDAPDFAAAVAGSMVLFHAGQICAACTRLLVPRSRHEEAVAVLRSAYAQVGENWGGFDAPNHVMGPVISRRQLDRVTGFIASAQAEGATLLAGGRARPDRGGGYFVEPTCFVDVHNEMNIAQEEVFGPVLVVITYEDDEDAVRIANDTIYGLTASVTGGDMARAERLARRLRVGSVSINRGVCIGSDLPYGGYRQSGIGRESGLDGIREYRETKVIARGVSG